MFRYLAPLLVLPLPGLLAQGAPLHIVITAPNNATFRVAHLADDPVTRNQFGRGRWEMTTDSATVRTMAFIATDPLVRIHVEARENDRIVASGDGAFVTVRRDTGTVSVESRSHAPSAPPGDLRKP
jgi:hypothetical protein